MVYKLDSAGNYTVLYTFTGGVDGGDASGGVIRDSAGNLYGTAFYGGTANAGVVYKLDSAGNYTVLYNFTGGADGGNPQGGVVLTPAGNLIGTTQRGGKYGERRNVLAHRRAMTPASAAREESRRCSTAFFSSAWLEGRHADPACRSSF